jgi:outer membrane protein
MKKIILLLVACAAIFDAETSNAQKIAYVDMQDIVSSMPAAGKADTAIQKYQQELYQQYQTMQKELQDEAGTFVKDSTTMSEAVKQVKRGSLQDLNVRIQQFRQNINNNVNKKYSDLMKPIIDQAQAAVGAVAKAKGYSYVLDDSEQAKVLIIKPDGDNLTAAVKAKLGLK